MRFYVTNTTQLEGEKGGKGKGEKIEQTKPVVMIKKKRQVETGGIQDEWGVMTIWATLTKGRGGEKERKGSGEFLLQERFKGRVRAQKERGEN